MASARLRNDPYKFVRPVKGGRWQARPYCDIERRRVNLGCFPTRDQAAKAVREFWWGKRPEKKKFVRPVRHKDGSIEYIAHVPVVMRGYSTPEAAARAAATFVRGHYGLWAEAVLAGRDLGSAPPP